MARLSARNAQAVTFLRLQALHLVDEGSKCIEGFRVLSDAATAAVLTKVLWNRGVRGVVFGRDRATVFRMSAAVSTDQLLSALNWRYATKKFDPTKRIQDEVWAALEQALILSPSSMGLQPWKFIVVTDPAVKARLVGASYKQTQVADCSHLVVFAVHRSIGGVHVEKYLDRVASVKEVAKESLAGFGKMITGNLSIAAKEGRLDAWQTHQIYIALGQFMTAAALLRVDTCPMEGIEAEKYDEILGLSGGDFATVVVCPAGYRAEGDKYAMAKKVRFEAKDVVVRV
jgi:nitroreductase